MSKPKQHVQKAYKPTIKSQNFATIFNIALINKVKMLTTVLRNCI